MGPLTWIVVGAIAGWLSGQVMKPGGYGVAFDVFLGILSSLVGGWIFEILELWPGRGMFGFAIATAVGALTLVGLTRVAKRAHRRILERLEQ
jgi:uncharacterized membrane protein YeaQ/YmgE (transglycosylase-associated protein family)